MVQKAQSTIKCLKDQLENTPRLVDTHHEPAPGIALIIERTGDQDMLVRRQDSLIGEAINPAMSASTGMRLSVMGPLAHRRAN